jgi:OOP family OmpA-OmpF porin
MNTPLLAASVSHLFGALVLAVGLGPTAHAAEAASGLDDDKGLYVGIGLGASKLGPRDEGHDGGSSGGRPGAAKLYGGYRLTDTWGLEAGLVQLGRVHHDTTAADGATVHHNGHANSLYLAGTGRVPLGHGFSLTGKAGVSFGRVSAQEPGDADFTLGGHQAALLLGVGAEYQVSRNVALTLDLDGYGKVSHQVKASTVTLGLRYGF